MNIFLFSSLFFGSIFFTFIPTLAGNNLPFLGPKPNFEGKEKKKIINKNPLLKKPYSQLKKEKDAALAKKDLAAAVKYLDAMRINCPQKKQLEEIAQEDSLKDILLEMADIYFTLEQWQNAEKAYKEFILLFPGANRCDYAHYRAIQSSIKQTLTLDRDQTKTQETLSLTQEFLKTYPNSELHQAVIECANECQQKLFESEVNVFNFYLKNNNIHAAQTRLASLNKDFSQTLSQEQPRILELTIQLAQAKNDVPLLLTTQLELGQKFGDHLITKRLGIDITTIQTQLALLEKESSLQKADTNTFTIS